MYPNPSEGWFYIEGESIPETLFVYDIQGRQLALTQHVSDTGVKLIEIEHVVSGLYFLHAGKQVFKLQIQIP